MFQLFNFAFKMILLFLKHLPIWGLRAVTNIRDSFISLLILSVLAWIPTTQFSVKETEASPSSLAECNTFLIFEWVRVWERGREGGRERGAEGERNREREREKEKVGVKSLPNSFLGQPQFTLTNGPWAARWVGSSTSVGMLLFMVLGVSLFV